MRSNYSDELLSTGASTVGVKGAADGGIRLHLRPMASKLDSARYTREAWWLRSIASGHTVFDAGMSDS